MARGDTRCQDVEHHLCSAKNCGLCPNLSLQSLVRQEAAGLAAGRFAAAMAEVDAEEAARLKAVDAYMARKRVRIEGQVDGFVTDKVLDPTLVK